MNLETTSLLLENTNYVELVHAQINKHLTKMNWESEYKTGDKMLDFIAHCNNIYADKMNDPDDKERIRAIECQQNILSGIVESLTNYGAHIRSKYIRNWKDKVENRSVMNEYFDLLSATFAKGLMSVQPYFLAPHDPVIDLPHDNDIVIETFMNFAGGSAKMAKESGMPGINNIREYTKGLLTGNENFNGFSSLQQNVREHIAKEETVSDVATDDVEQLPAGLLVMAKEAVKDANGKNTGEVWWLYAIPSTSGKDPVACDQLASAAKEAAVGLTRSGGERGGKEGTEQQGSDAVWCFRNYNTALNYLKWCSLLIIYHQAIVNGIIRRAVPVHAGTLPNNDTLSNNGHLLSKVEFKDHMNKSCPIPHDAPPSIRSKYMHLIRSNNALLAYQGKTEDKTAISDPILVSYLYSDPSNSVSILESRATQNNLAPDTIQSIRQKLLNPPKGISKSPYCLLLDTLVSTSPRFKEMVLDMRPQSNGPILPELIKILSSLPMPRRIITKIGLGGGNETQDSYAMLSKTAERLQDKIGNYDGDLELICIMPLKLETYIVSLDEQNVAYSSQLLNRLYERTADLYKQSDLKNPSAYERDMFHTIPIVIGVLFKAARRAKDAGEVDTARHEIAAKFRSMVGLISEMASQSILRNVKKEDLDLIYQDDASYFNSALSKAISYKFLNEKERTPEVTSIKLLAENNILAEDLPIADLDLKSMIVNRINKYVDQYEASIGTPSYKKTSVLFKLPEYSNMRKHI